MLPKHEKVLRTPITTSISKNLYSFPKSSRFEKSRESPCRRSFYNVRINWLGSKAAGFGYADKVSLVSSQGISGPGSYEETSQFDHNKTRQRGYSFRNYHRSSTKRQQDELPGPGQYDGHAIAETPKAYSFRCKYKDPEQDKNTLGPGHYEPIATLNSSGHYFYSNYKNSGCSKIGRTRRFVSSNTEAPGPGKYDDRLNLNKTGYYFNSKVTSKHSYSFLGTSRKPINDHSEAPGPGAYYIFPQFTKRQK